MHHRAWTREEALARLEGAERSKTQDPEALWDRAGLKAGETVADIGAGTGYFAIPAARRVGPAGRILAIDLSDELVGLIRERRDREGLKQIEAVHCGPESIPLPNAIADVVLLANVLHDLPAGMVGEAVRLLKPDGRLLNLDWKREQSEFGPPLEVRIEPDTARQLLETAGLQEAERWEPGTTHYAARFVRAQRRQAATH